MVKLYKAATASILYMWCFFPTYSLSQPPYFVKNFGNSSFSEISTSAVVPNSQSGSIYISGYVDEQSSNGVDGFFMKIASNGDSLFLKHYGDNLNNYFWSSVAVSPNEIYIVGFTETATNSQDALLIKLDTLGNELLYKTFGTTSNESFKEIKKTPDGNLVCVGNATDVNGNYDAYIIKMDLAGGVIWQTTYGNTTNTDIGDGVVVLSNGNIAMGITTVGDNGTDFDQEIVHYTASGVYTWRYIIDDALNNGSQSIAINKFDELLIIGETASASSPVFDYFVTAVNASGNFLWQKKFGSTEPDAAFYGTSDKNGNFYVCGYNGVPSGDVDLGVLKISRDGTIRENKLYASGSNDIGYFCEVINDSTLIVTGKYGDAGNNVFLIKSDLKTDFPEPLNTSARSEEIDTWLISPNPCSNQLCITSLQDKFNYKIYNSIGELCKEGVSTSNCIQLESLLTKGLYSLQINSGSKINIQKFLVIDE